MPYLLKIVVRKMDKNFTVTFGIIAFNEHEHLPELLHDLLQQTYPHKLMEVILVDGVSNDDTKSIMTDFCELHSGDFLSINVLENPERIQPAGWNTVISAGTGDILLRVDAHARIPKDFVERNVDCISSGEYVCGGLRENIIDEETPWKRTLLKVEQSMFGSGIAPYRHGETKKYVKSVFSPAYRKEVIQNVGLFNEKLSRTEDNEYHYRVLKKGYKICYDQLIHSSYQTRNNLKDMVMQKYMNGFWIGKTLFYCPGCISVFHLVPFLFVAALAAAAITGIVVSWVPFTVLCLTYSFVDLCISILTTLNDDGEFYPIVLPVIFPIVHISYGLGTLNGIISGLFRKS